MPTRTSADSDARSTHSAEHQKPMPSSAPSQPGPALPPVYANSVAKGNFDEFLQKHLGNKDSMITNYNSSSQQRKQYYEEHLQYKDNVNGSVRERVQREAPVLAELRTNVIIKDEFTLINDVGYHLAARYTRPDSSIMVSVNHSACLAMGGTFEPCYLLTITTIPSQLGPTMNKRNAALIQSFMADILSVPPSRGLVFFVPTPEENFATDGTTISGHIEKKEKQSADGSTMRRAINSAGRKSMPSFKKSMSKLDSEQRGVDSKSPEPTGIYSDDRGDATATAAAMAMSPVGVFELPATENEKRRPATSHAHSSSTGSNGLRMNGISSKANQKNAGKSKGRPRTLSGGEATSIQEQVKNNAASLTAASFLKTEPIKLQSSSRPTIPRQRHSGASAGDRSRKRDSYSTMANEHGAKKSMDEKQIKEREKKANMAKRRSTINDPPLFKALEPPPIPDSADDMKSTRSMRLGKRKSFLSAFRRSTPATAG